MRLRMYVTLPDVASARQIANDLLLARIEDKHMHFLARRGVDLGELHEASYLQKTDTVHGAFTGLVIGGIAGVVGGFLLVNFPPGDITLHYMTVLATSIVGAIFGVWVASMVGLQVPNTRLKSFEKDIEGGKVLLMLDVPMSRCEQVKEVILRTHPEAADRGMEPTVPAFP